MADFRKTIRFGTRHGECAAVVGTGWSGPEASFRWSVGKISTLVLPELGDPHEEAETRVTVWIVPQMSPRASAKRLAVEYAGRTVKEIVLTGRAVITFTLPRGANGGEVTFHQPDTWKPGPGTHDMRSLAIMFQRMMVHRRIPDVSAKSVMERFISLGTNCEFGLVQRFYGVEHIDLFRFSSTDMHALLSGFDSNFAEIGNPEMLRLNLAGPVPREYMGIQPRYAMRYHTFINENSPVPADTLLARESGRLTFLGRKLIEDAQSARRIFLIRMPRPDLEATDAIPLLEALQRHNPDNRLLAVGESCATLPRFRVVQVAPGLYSGTVPYFAPVEDAYSYVPGPWLTMCREMLALCGEDAPPDDND